MNGADLDHRFARSRVPLVVPAVPPVATQPGEGPLHHIPLGLLHEPHFPRRTADDFDHVPRLRLNQPVVEVMVVVLPVPPDSLQATPVLGRHSPQHLGGERAVVGGGHRDYNDQQQPQLIHEDMPLPPGDQLAPSYPRLSAISLALTVWLSMLAT